jgi:hypothetical protein
MGKAPYIDRVGDVVMANRTYNSKRIVWEPFIVTGETVDPNWPGRRRLVGTWLLDGCASGAYDRTKPFDPKWAERKIAELEAEEARLHNQRLNLENLLANTIT